MLPNYIRDTNRFQLADPPKWWLKKLWEFDDSLVIIPSRQGYNYILAQKRPPRLSERIVSDIMKEQANTKMLSENGLVLVAPMYMPVNWANPMMWEDLKQRAPWRMGGAEKMNRMILEKEHKAELDKAAKIDENNTARAKDAWGYYRMKSGLQSNMWIPKTSRSEVESTAKAPSIRTTNKTLNDPTGSTGFEG